MTVTKRNESVMSVPLHYVMDLRLYYVKDVTSYNTNYLSKISKLYIFYNNYNINKCDGCNISFGKFPILEGILNIVMLCNVGRLEY